MRQYQCLLGLVVLPRSELGREHGKCGRAGEQQDEQLLPVQWHWTTEESERLDRGDSGITIAWPRGKFRYVNAHRRVVSLQMLIKTWTMTPRIWRMSKRSLRILVQIQVAERLTKQHLDRQHRSECDSRSFVLANACQLMILTSQQRR